MNQNKQPNSDFCFICGRNNPRGLHMSFFDDGEDRVWSQYAVPDLYQSYPGIVHGGIVSAMLDEAVGRVALIGDHHKFMVSVRLEVKFRQPVPTETPLELVGRIVRMTALRGKAVGELLLPDGTIAAETSITLAEIPKRILEAHSPEALGWRVDP